MKAYLIVTGSLFGLMALAHLFVTVTHWNNSSLDLEFVIRGPGIGLIALSLFIWAGYLFRLRMRT